MIQRDDGKGTELCSYCGTAAFALLDVHEGRPPEPFCAVCALAVLGSTVAHAAKDAEPLMPDFPAMHHRSHPSLNGRSWCDCGGRRWTIVEVNDKRHAIVSPCPVCNPEGTGT